MDIQGVLFLQLVITGASCCGVRLCAADITPTRPTLSPLTSLQLAFALPASFAALLPLFHSAAPSSSPPKTSPLSALFPGRLLLRARTNLAKLLTLAHATSPYQTTSSFCMNLEDFAGSPHRLTGFRSPLYNHTKNTLGQHRLTSHGTNCPAQLCAAPIAAPCPGLLTSSHYVQNKFCHACSLFVLAPFQVSRLYKGVSFFQLVILILPLLPHVPTRRFRPSKNIQIFFPPRGGGLPRLARDYPE